MRSKSSVQNLKAVSKCMFRILVALCLCIVLMVVMRMVFIKSTEALRAILSEETVRAIRKLLKIFFGTASVYQSLHILLTVLFYVIIDVSFFTCVFSVFVCITVFFMNVGTQCRAFENQQTTKFSDTVLTNCERLFLLFGRIRA